MARRHLPVLNDTKPPPSSVEPEDDERPAWHWIGFGTVAIFAAWLPLAYVAQAATRSLAARWFAEAAALGAAAPDAEGSAALARALDAMTPAERALRMTVLASPNALAFALAAFGGGFLVGRFARHGGPREAALSGACAAFVAVVIAWGGASLVYAATAAVIVVLAVAFAALGGRVGSKRAASRAI